MRENITGLRSGRLTAIEPTDQKRRGCTLWRCQCDCGKESFQEAYKIVNGKVKSCGCSRKGHGMKELTDQRFGRLVAVERLSRKKGSNYLWLCRCDCGREIEASTNALKLPTWQIRRKVFLIIDVAPLIYNDRTYLPVRAVAEAMGAKVDWSDSENAVYITK